MNQPIFSEMNQQRSLTNSNQKKYDVYKISLFIHQEQETFRTLRVKFRVFSIWLPSKSWRLFFFDLRPSKYIHSDLSCRFLNSL